MGTSRRVRALIWLLVTSCFSLGLAACTGLPAARPAGGLVSVVDRGADNLPTPQVATIPLTMDANRLYAEISFRKADGSSRKAMAWVNFGMGGMTLSPALRRELGAEGAVSFSLGGIPIRVEPGALLPVEEDDFAQLGPFPVEASLPAVLWTRYRVTLDYAARTLTLEPSNTAMAAGARVPIEVNDRTGFVTVPAVVDGERHNVVLDPGSGFSWWRGDVVRGWLAKHPDWYRADGAIGQSNQAMLDEAFEQKGTVVRVPLMRLATLELHEVGILGSADGLLGIKGPLFWQLWGAGASEPIDGWLGANALHPYRITIDYPRRMSYWERTGAPDPHELMSVGISLVHNARGYLIGGLVGRHGRVTEQDVRVGDTLIAVDGRDAKTMTRGTMIEALTGHPGDNRRLTLERSGKTLTTDIPVEVENFAP